MISYFYLFSSYKSGIFNNTPVYEVPYLFSYQHLLLLLISIFYIIMLCRILGKKSYIKQRKVLITLNCICCLIFAGRTLWGWPGSTTTLLPLELCNINILITLLILVLQKKWLYHYLYFVSMLGAIISLTIFPECHMNINLFQQYMFWDYYLIHSTLVAIPIVMIACGWFKPSYKYIFKSLLLLVVVWLGIFLLTVLLRNFPAFSNANYIYTYDPGTLPILSQLYKVIPIPFVYELPLLPLVLVLFLLLGFPFWIYDRVKNRKEK